MTGRYYDSIEFLCALAQTLSISQYSRLLWPQHFLWPSPLWCLASRTGLATSHSVSSHSLRAYSRQNSLLCPRASECFGYTPQARGELHNPAFREAKVCFAVEEGASRRYLSVQGSMVFYEPLTLSAGVSFDYIPWRGMPELRFVNARYLRLHFDIRNIYIQSVVLCCDVRTRWSRGGVFWLQWNSFIIYPDSHSDQYPYEMLMFIDSYQTPPALLERSKTVTSRPAALRCSADATPLAPAPMTATFRTSSAIFKSKKLLEGRDQGLADELPRSRPSSPFCRGTEAREDPRPEGGTCTCGVRYSCARHLQQSCVPSITYEILLKMHVRPE